MLDIDEGRVKAAKLVTVKLHVVGEDDSDRATVEVWLVRIGLAWKAVNWYRISQDETCSPDRAYDSAGGAYSLINNYYTKAFSLSLCIASSSSECGRARFMRIVSLSMKASPSCQITPARTPRS